jgi:hypothetical protein
MGYASSVHGEKLHEIRQLSLFKFARGIELDKNLEKFRNFFRKISKIFDMVSPKTRCEYELEFWLSNRVKN